MKKLLSILGAVNLTAIGASSVTACSSEKTKQIQNGIDNDKILEEKINTTSLENIADSTKQKISKEAEYKIYEFQEKQGEYSEKFETNNKDINLQLYILFTLKKAEAHHKRHGIQHGKLKQLPPDENDPRYDLYKEIKQIQKEVFKYIGKEYKIHKLIVKLASQLENKYYK